MSDRKYPRFRTTKNLELKFSPQVGVMSCSYEHIVRTFGQPSLSADNNDQFDGTEQCAWIIQFESGESASIAEERGFGDRDHDYKKSTTWKVNTRTPRVYDWIKEAIRDANPNG
jgi:hypothetical protein